MGLIVPYPSVPSNGQPVDATQLLANLNAIYQAIQSFDASQIQAATLVASAFAASINPNTILNDTIKPFVQTGCVWSSVSGLNGTMTAGVIYAPTPSSTILRVTVNPVGSNTFTASKDTYIDIDYNGNITYSAVSNGATAPALTANSVRVAKVVTNGSAITSVTQFGSDGIGNILYPTGPTSAKLIQNPYKFSAYRNSAWTDNVTPTALVMDTVSFDTGSNYSNSTGKFTAPVAGFYWFSSAVGFVNTTTVGIGYASYLYKNGSIALSGSSFVSEYNGTNWTNECVVSGLLQLAANDYVQVFQNGKGGGTGGTGPSATYFHGFLVSAT